MSVLTLEDILKPGEYEKIRSRVLQKIVELKKKRRLILGDKMSVVFENKDTLWYQVQEMVRVEHMEQDELIQEELDVYNPLLPEKGVLSATLFIELPNPETVLEELQRFHGIESEDTVYLEFQPGPRIHAVFDVLYRNPEKVATVYFIKFHLHDDALKLLDDPGTGLYFIVDHPNYYVRAQVPMELRKDLAREARTGDLPLTLRNIS